MFAALYAFKIPVKKYSKQTVFLFLGLSMIVLGCMGLVAGGEFDFLLYGFASGFLILFCLTIYKMILVLKGKEKLGLF